MKLNEVKEFVKELVVFLKKNSRSVKMVKKELFELRFQAAAGQLGTNRRLKEVKKTNRSYQNCSI